MVEKRKKKKKKVRLGKRVVRGVRISLVGKATKPGKGGISGFF